MNYARVGLGIALPNGVADGDIAHGALFLGGSYTDNWNFDPVITIDVYYSTANDITPPTIESATAQQQGSTVRFAVKVSDASGVLRVVVTYTDGAGA